MRELVLAVAPLLLVAFAGCTEKENGREIEVDDNYFKPDSTSARVGEMFEFESEGKIDHTVTVHRPPAPATESLKDEVLKPGQKTTFTFDAAGTYHVFCKYHGSIGAGMHLNVTVTA